MIKRWWEGIPIGTRSILVGAHCFGLHPWFVAAAWWQLYGMPLDPRLWIAFFVHDLGYWGKPNMDGPEGETHVEWAANLMGRWFGQEWDELCRYHSRFYAKQDDKPFSKLCVADKLAMCLEPWWLYVARTALSGEIYEYMARNASGNDKYSTEPRFGTIAERLRSPIKRVFFEALREYMLGWINEHRDGREDTWTKRGDD
jgi:hypothetical protein